MPKATQLKVFALGLFCLLALSGFSGNKAKMADLNIDQMAPDFEAKDSSGKTHKLKDYRGKYVVLEWLNHGCPYVKKHYDSGNMQKMQAELDKKGAVWFSIISSAPGKQGHMSAKEASASIAKYNKKLTAILLDPQGEIGRRYGARTTPHFFVIDPKGKIAYQGAIDSKRSTDQDDIPSSTNYVLAAFAQFDKGARPKPAKTEPYGCSVKYP